MGKVWEREYNELDVFISMDTVLKHNKNPERQTDTERE